MNDSKNRKNLLVLDFDDTLFPTTFYIKHQTLSGLDVLSAIILELILKAEKTCEVILLTSASPLWIEKCVLLFSEELQDKLNNIKILYANWRECDLNEALQIGVSRTYIVKNKKGDDIRYCSDMNGGKFNTFYKLLEAFILHTNIDHPFSCISVGDSEDERFAVFAVTEKIVDKYYREDIHKIIPKSIKFKSYPSPEEIVTQLIKLMENLNSIIEDQFYMDIVIV